MMRADWQGPAGTFLGISDFRDVSDKPRYVPLATAPRMRDNWPVSGPVATIVHADMDAFYAAVERRDHPELRGKPVIVGGTRNRGVVLTASYEARVYGVHSAMPAVEARRLCPHGIFVPPRLSCYAAAARQIRTVFEEFTPLVEPLSLDEAFLDVTASLQLFASARHIGEQLKQRVHAVTALTVSVGIAPTKMAAKIASGMCKPDGLLEVTPEGLEDFLHPLPVSQLWGVGPVMQRQLTALGITTIGALAACNPTHLERRLGSAGIALRNLAHGRDHRVVDADRQRKSYGEECTFERDIRDGELARRTIREHAEAVARRLRAEGCRGRTVTLKVKLAQRIGPGKYPILTRSLTLPVAADDGKSIADAALTLWDGVQAGKTVRLIGVSVSAIDDRQGAQLALFPDQPTQRRAALNQALDRLAARFGHNAVRRGTLRAKS
jgi:DNA polymerase IV